MYNILQESAKKQCIREQKSAFGMINSSYSCWLTRVLSACVYVPMLKVFICTNVESVNVVS